MMQELSKDFIEFGQKLIQNVTLRVNQRRTVWSKILYTLHHGAPNSDDSDSDCENFQVDLSVDRKTLKSHVLPLIRRLYPKTKDYPKSDEVITQRSEPQILPSSVEDTVDLSLREKMRYRKPKIAENCDQTGNTHDSADIACFCTPRRTSYFGNRAQEQREVNYCNSRTSICLLFVLQVSKVKGIFPLQVSS
ncbi:unnamed protein product [Allacma fusca]|uniref:Uncharacterized protein n=1 Tax=Allacma fusca TaxID=39272 RepID=A0A8J2JJF5_9HEXA|nr:unnamed protein product [Allacma fusca]